MNIEIKLQAIEYTVNGKLCRREYNDILPFWGAASDALSCFVDVWANHEDEPFSWAFRKEMEAVCDKAVKAMNIYAYGEEREMQYDLIEKGAE